MEDLGPYAERIEYIRRMQILNLAKLDQVRAQIREQVQKYVGQPEKLPPLLAALDWEVNS